MSRLHPADRYRILHERAEARAEQRLAEEDLRVRAAQQGSLATLSQRALEMHDREELFAEAAALLRETLRMDRGLVLHSRRSTDPLTVEVTVSPSDAAPGRLTETSLTADAPRGSRAEARGALGRGAAGRRADPGPIRSGRPGG